MKLKVWIERFKISGMEQVTFEEFKQRYADIGFTFDTSCTILQTARFVTGEWAGEGYPEKTMYPVQIGTGMSAFHVDMPGEIREKVKILRNGIFAVSQGRIVEV